jgi:transglutaminase-like putative cysteine protease
MWAIRERPRRELNPVMKELTQSQPRRPQLDRDELHRLRWLLGGVVTLLSAWTIFYLEIDAWALMTLTSLAAIAGVVWPRLPSKVPSFVHTFAFPLVAAFFLGDLWLKGDALPAIIRLDLLLLFYRAISYRQRRDDLQVIVLGLFLIVVAGVLTVSLLFAVQLLAFAGCSLGLLLVLTLLQPMEEGASDTAKGLRPPTAPTWVDGQWPKLFARLRQATDWRIVVLGGVLFVGVVGLSALLFVLIPRFQLENSLFLERFATRKARTGFSDTIKFGDVTAIQQDTSVALSVDVSDRSKVPAAPYWRMLVLDRYEDGTFKLSQHLRLFLKKPLTDAVIDGPIRKRGTGSWKFYLEAGVSRYLPLLAPFSELQFADLQSYQFSPTLNMVALTDEPATMIAYRVEGFDASGTLNDPGFAELWKHREGVKDLALPPIVQTQIGLGSLTRPDRDTLAQIVAEVAAEKLHGSYQTPALEFIAQATQWLRTHHQYSLTPQTPGGGGDPLVRWMNSRGAGHCELFAGSLVLLARSAGFPARIVTGFHGGSWNSYSNNLTVRNSDAHAWAEIFDEQKDLWREADALAAPIASAEAAAGGATTRARQVDRGWSARVESLRIFWYRRIVSFDQRSQLETIKALKDTTENTGRQLRETVNELVSKMILWFKRPWSSARITRLLAVALVGLGGYWLWREFCRDWWRSLVRRMRGDPFDPVRTDAGRWLTKLAKIEHLPPENLPVLEALQRLRYGARASWPEPKPVFRRARRLARGAPPARSKAPSSRAL